MIAGDLLPHGPPSAVAAVVVNWNGGEETAACVRSLLSQSGATPRVCVVDNGSSDGSAERLAAEFPDVTLIRTGANRGFAAGANAGMRWALAEGAGAILLLNNDATLAPAAVANLLRALRAGRAAGVAVVTPLVLFADRPDRVWAAGGAISRRLPFPRSPAYRRPASGWRGRRRVTFASGCALLVAADAVRRVGLLDETLAMYGEDADWSLRFAAAGYAMEYAPEAVVLHKGGSSARRRSPDGSFALHQSTRNLLVVGLRHAAPGCRPIFLGFFLVRWFAYMLLKQAIRGRFAAARAILSGAAQGLHVALRERRRS
ncbi:MAG: glycosyltransferase family 2 protein [Planctomycetes bacterium]|nr:glycosyltransferase family 2 protein [Planctomycetota bacterium]